MRPFDFDLLGCPVTDYASGEVLGRVKVVVRSPTPGRIAQLVLERLDAPARVGGLRSGLAAGTALYDARGGFAGWTVGVAESVSPGGMTLEGGSPGGGRFLLVREPVDGEESVLDGLDPLEGNGAYGDYMVGQVAACTLWDPQGQVVIREGEVITAAVLERARGLGLLHRLEATF